MHVLRKASRGHLGEEVSERLRAEAEESVALPGARTGLKREVRLLQDQITMYNRQMKEIQDGMVEVMLQIPEAACLMSIPGVAPVSAAVFLGALGDVHAYRSSRQVLKLAGLSLVQESSGIRHGYDRLSKSGRPLLRRLAFMLGLRGVRSDGLYWREYQAMLLRNGGRKMPATVAMGRKMLCLMFAIARERRTFTPVPLQAG